VPAGLGKNSPVVLSLNRSSYEALIERHGQWIRWRTATKCPCPDKDTMQPDPRCPRCKGTGVFYSNQKEIVVTETLGFADKTGIVEVQEQYESATLNMIYDYNGKKYPAEKDGVYISIDEPVEKGTYLYAVMNLKTVKRIMEAECENIGGGYYRINGLQSRKAGIDGLYQTAPGDIEKIEKIIDAAGHEWEVGEFRADMFTLKPQPAPEPLAEPLDEPVELAEPLTAHGVEYVPPFLFALMSQNLSKPDEKMLVDAKGDALCTFPYNCNVGDDDTLTVLVGSHIQKEVVNRVNFEYDVIGAYFVLDITSCVGIGREYRKGEDFLLCGTNRIKWLCDDAPATGEAYSITYQVCPTYKVIKAIPQIRTSENQRLPKKVIVQLISQYGEKKGVNQQ
jgi:hypothetical protein